MQETTALIIFISAALYTAYKFVQIFTRPKPSGCLNCHGSCGTKIKNNRVLPTIPLQGNKLFTGKYHYVK